MAIFNMKEHVAKRDEIINKQQITHNVAVIGQIVIRQLHEKMNQNTDKYILMRKDEVGFKGNIDYKEDGSLDTEKIRSDSRVLKISEKLELLKAYATGNYTIEASYTVTAKEGLASSIDLSEYFKHLKVTIGRMIQDNYKPFWSYVYNNDKHDSKVDHIKAETLVNLCVNAKHIVDDVSFATLYTHSNDTTGGVSIDKLTESWEDFSGYCDLFKEENLNVFKLAFADSSSS